MTDEKFERIALIGIGLVGSSLALAIRRHQLADEIAIATKTQETLERAKQLNLGDSYSLDASEAVEGAELIVVAAPVGVCGEIAKQIAPAIRKGAILTDAGSTKASVIRDMKPHLPEHVRFIPGHPVAGTEKSGPEAGFAELFQNRWCILTPEENADPEALERLKRFWKTLGANVQIMDAEHHDKVLAIVSHLPHIIAYNIVGTADDLAAVSKSEVIQYSASGFRDFTRLAASDPVMWRDICLANSEAILEMLSRFSEDLAALQKAIRWGDGNQLFELFSRTRSVRRSIIEAGQESDSINFGRDHPDETGTERKTTESAKSERPEETAESAKQTESAK